MAGHSKWATTKRHKAIIDSKRSKLFNILSKEISITARFGGSNVNNNPKLRMLLNKAKSSNMPTEKIERAIKKGLGKTNKMIVEKIIYEGYSLNGVGLIVEVETSNKNRSASEIRNIFNKNKGNLAGEGSLSYNFQRKGKFLINKKYIIDENILIDIALSNSAESIELINNHFELICKISSFKKINQVLKDKNIKIESSQIDFIPSNIIEIKDLNVRHKIIHLIEELKKLDDVKNVWSNSNI